MKKIASIILSCLILLGEFVSHIVSSSTVVLPFTDVEQSQWYYEDIETVYSCGIMQGRTLTSFAPTENMSRSEFVTVLCRLSNDTYEGKGNSLVFLDTDKNMWYADFVAWGVESGIVKGLPGNMFAPNQAVTRQDMAVFINRFFEYLDISASDNPQIDAFVDEPLVASYAREAIEIMRKSGIIMGDQNGYFNPNDNASRAEVATVVARIHSIIDKVDFAPPIPYTTYLPVNYSSESQYPLVVYISIYNKGGVKKLFDSELSPAHDSIVIVPHLSVNNWSSDKVEKFVRYINNRYSTDPSRQYVIATDSGGFIAWQSLLKYPQLFTSALFVQSAIVRFWNTDDGYVVFEEDINIKMADMPIHIVHDTTGTGDYYPDYGKRVYDALKKAGYKNIEFKETIGYGDSITHNFVTKDDVSLIEWLFSQCREDK